jgi:hypothetical protein
MAENSKEGVCKWSPEVMMEAAARLKWGRSAKKGISLPAPFFARQGCGSSWRAPTR